MGWGGGSGKEGVGRRRGNERVGEGGETEGVHEGGRETASARQTEERADEGAVERA